MVRTDMGSIHNGVQQLEKLIRSGVLQGAVHELHRLSKSNDMRISLAAAGVAIPLVSLTSSICKYGATNGDCRDPLLLRSAIGCLRQLCLEPKIKPMIASAGLLPPLMRLLGDAYSNGAGAAMAAARKASSPSATDPAADAVAAAGAGVGGSSSLYGWGWDEPLLTEAVQCVRELMMEEQCRLHIADSTTGGVEVLLGMCQPWSPSGILEGAAWSLWSLTREPRTRGQLAAVGGIDTLVALCTMDVEPSVRTAACWTLAHVTQEPDIRPVVANANGVPVLVKLCQLEKDHQILAATLSTLANLILDASVRVMVVTAGALMPLIDICQSSQNASVLQGATRCLAHLASDVGLRRKLVQVGTSSVSWY
jgi:hypothetical protein